MIETVTAAVTELVKEASIFPIKEISESTVSETPIHSLMETIDNTLLESLEVQNETVRYPTRNEYLDGSAHPETGVPYERINTIVDGKNIEHVRANFDDLSLQDIKLPDELRYASDKEQFTECNRQLKEILENNPESKTKYDEVQLEQIKNGDTPDGLTWHHDTEVCKMQLVDTEIHSKTGHTGGKAIWGGGFENR